MKKKPPPSWVPKSPQKRGSDLAPLSEVLLSAETFLAKQTGAAMPRKAWSAVVGQRIAQRTRVGRLNRGVLTIFVASSSWSAELSFLKADLLRKLQGAGYEVRELRFLVDDLGTPKAPTGPFRRRAAAPQELPPDLQERLRKIEDPNLRAAIAEAARHSLKKEDPT